MQTTEEKESRLVVTPTETISEPLMLFTPNAVQPAEDEYDSPGAIFMRAVAEIPTQPLSRHFTPQWKLQQSLERHCIFLMLLVVLSLLTTAILNIINQPLVTVTLLPVHKRLQLTTTIPIQTRQLAPVALTRTATNPTTGKGHQDARAATGTLTFYNGLFTVQTIAQGTVFTGADGVKVLTDQAVSIPPNNPPEDGQATITAQALNVGAVGNIRAGDINTTISNGVLVKNSQFIGGRDARDYQAVAQRDLDTLTAKLQQQLIQAMPRAFSTRPSEVATPINCTFVESADHRAGEEAKTLTIHASKTCSAIVYNQNALQQKVSTIFNATRPGKQYELVSSVQTHNIISLSPLTVRVSGSWSYVFTSDYEQFLAQQIQGDTPAQARAYLFKTGLVSRVTITQTQSLPDWYHIKFLIIIGV